MSNAIVSAVEMPVGLGRIATELHAGGEREPPKAIGRAPGLAGPVPTNQWYSSLLFNTWPQPLYAHPASYRPTADGFEIDVPVKQVVQSATREENDITFPHRRALVLQPTGFALKSAQLAKASDWAIDIATGDGTQSMLTTIAHGSPYSYHRLSSGDVRFGADSLPELIHRSADGRVTALRVLGQPYAIFAPAGATWSGWTLRLPEGRRWFSIAALPDARAETIAEFGRHAHAFVTDTRVTWAYDEARAELTTTYRVSTEPMEGGSHDTLLGLYPHQWHRNPLLPATLPWHYDSVRGPLKLVAGTQFQTRYRYTGLLPHWPALGDPAARAQLQALLAKDLQFGADDLLARKGGTYWEGKGLNRAAQAMAIAEAHGETAQRDAILAAMKQRLERWFKAGPDDPRYFHYRADLGTLIGYPDEFGSAAEMNDHHFHYGYWIHAAAQIALRDPQWAARSQWGGMVEQLIADIANTDSAETRYPRLRHFDRYEGHSWASGIVPFADGNNQESSSEAIHAWAGLILWGEATGNQAVRDTGIYLYTTEIQALQHYWFDLHHQVFAPEYQNTEATMVWGAKYVHTTWWTEDPREAHGINLLPITAASLYLGADPAYVKRNLAAMDVEFDKFIARGGSAPRDIWQDILLSYLALADAPEAIRRWDPDGAVEDGETRSHTFFWLHSLAELGRPQLEVTADTPLYGVFQRADGRRTYLAFNAGREPRNVRFSDGTVLRVPPRQLSRIHRSAPTALTR